jgi:hypothetical protein
MNKISLISAIFYFSISFLFGQEIFLKSGSYNSAEYPEISELKINDGQKYGIIIFSQLPSNSDKLELSKQGIELLDYLPRNAFYARVDHLPSPFTQTTFKINRIIAMDDQFKLSELLVRNEFPHWALYGDNHIEIIAQYFSLENAGDLLNKVHSIGIQVIEQDDVSRTFLLRVPKNKLNELYGIAAFQYFETPTPPGEPENLPGRTSHRSNTLYSYAENGLKYRGDNVRVMMQDDGYIGPHIDFTGRTNQSFCSPCSASPDNNHGDHVAGTIMGAGNINPRNRGMAHGVELYVYNSSNNNYGSVPNLYDNEDVFITSKSYSDGCNSGYSNLTRSLDQQVRLYPSLVHVFSAGNNGTSDCDYGAGTGWGNITGGHKSGKNVIAVGNLTNTGSLAGSSSRGPATDGRIKPDICGVGTAVNSTIYGNEYASFTGTSMSCPGVSGTIAQLFDAYRDLNAGANPDAAIVKGTILNTADDFGNPGPDFKFGWGSLNARRAFEVIRDQTFMTDQIANGGINEHAIEVPANVKQLRVMLYWMDFEGSTSAAIALVNDLNMTLTDPASTVFEPWVLDPTPTVAALDAVAVRGVDNLNNVEQVTIDNPTSGEYVVHVDGFSVPQGPQNYYIIYYFEMEDIIVTYPNGGENFSPSTNEQIRWDAPEGTDGFILSFSDDNGGSWTEIGTASSSARLFPWNIPNGTLTSEGLIRIERDGVLGESESVFSVIGIPNSLGLEWVCPDSLLLTWDPVSGADTYEVSILGAKYMDSLTTVSDTSAVVYISSTVETWFSVKSLNDDGAIGQRAIAIQKTAGEFGCLWSAPYAAFDIDCPTAGQMHCFNLSDESINTDNTAAITWYFPGGTPSVAAGQSPQVCYAAPGLYDVAMVVDNGFGVDSIYQTNYIDVIPTSTLPYVDGFEDITSFSNTDTWESVSIGVGPASFSVSNIAALSGDQSARLQNFGQPAEAIDELISGPIDLSVLDASDNVTLSFRYAYRKRNESNDEWLRVFIKADCLGTWAQRRTIRGSNLSPLVETSSWAPSSSEDWTTVHMTNVTSTFFTGDFRVKFQFESDGGNNFYLDDINMYLGDPSDEIVNVEINNLSQEFTVYPNPSEGELNIEFNQSNAGTAVIQITDVNGKLIQDHIIQAQVGNNMVFIETNAISPGMYLVHLVQGNSKATKKMIIQ